jgi:hypothetical protein
MLMIAVAIAVRGLGLAAFDGPTGAGLARGM